MIAFFKHITSIEHWSATLALTFSAPILLGAEQWHSNLARALPAAKAYLDGGELQEALWTFQHLEMLEEAQVVRKKLAKIMGAGPIKKHGIKKLGGGATDTKLISLEAGIRGVFKAKNRFHPSSDYLAEVAAYKIDQLGHFALVPMTIIRKIGKEIGSFQYFVAESRQVDENYIKSSNLEVFDYIINNHDRTARNILRKSDFEIAIDHGLALDLYSMLGGWLRIIDTLRDATGESTLRQRHYFPRSNPEKFLASSRIMRQLRKWSPAHLRRHLYPLLSMEQISMVYKKSRRILKYCDKKAKNNESTYSAR